MHSTELSMCETEGMSNEYIDPEGFKMVSRHKASRKKMSRCSTSSPQVEITGCGACVPSIDSVISKLSVCRTELQSCDFTDRIKDFFVTCGLSSGSGDRELFPGGSTQGQFDVTHDTQPRPANTSTVNHIVAYGIGNFSTCPIARYQLALFMFLCNLIQVCPEDCFAFDPRFISLEKEVLTNIGFQLIAVNEVGKRRSSVKTLYYMPHCGNALYNNLLWANWHPDAIRNTVILGNSFEAISNRLPSSILQNEFSYISRILPYTTEYRLPNTFRHTDIFNDLSLHVFLSDDAKTASVCWTDTCEPQYRGTEYDNEIIWSQSSDSNGS